jgi:hypothetical protein
MEPRKKSYGRTFTIYQSETERFEITAWKWDCGWYFGSCGINGYDINAEEELRERANDTDPEDLGIELHDAGRYFDYESFREDYYESLLENMVDLGDGRYEEMTSWSHFGKYGNNVLPEYDDNWTISKEFFSKLVKLKTEIDELKEVYEKERTKESLDKLEDKLEIWEKLVKSKA